MKIVDVNIRRLRMKVEDEPSHPTHILTVWGYGYRWRSKPLSHASRASHSPFGTFVPPPPTGSLPDRGALGRSGNGYETKKSFF